MDIEGNKTNPFFETLRPYIDQSNGAVSFHIIHNSNRTLHGLTRPMPEAMLE